MATRPNDMDGPKSACLTTEIDAFERDLPRLSKSQAVTRVDALRRLAQARGPHAAGALAGGMAQAFAHDRCTAMLPAWLQGMREAVGCADDDGDAAAILLASVSVRLVG